MKVKRLIRISYFTMLTVIGALASYRCEPFPITLQAFFAVLSGLVLGGTDGAASQILYIALGLVGLPVFAYGGGYKYVLEPTFGYLIGMAVGSFIAGTSVRRFKTINAGKVFGVGLAGLTSVYIIGMIYQVLIFVLDRGYNIVDAFKTLECVPIAFAVHAVLLLIVAFIYPKVKTMIGSMNREEFKDNGLPQSG